ncbi:MAG: S9 family peptidase [Chthonomonadales bacterium]
MAQRTVEIEDLLRFNLVSDVQISPDGSRVVYVVKRIDAEKNKYLTRLWMATDTTSIPFTGDGWSDTSPRWSPDGSQIAFTSNRNKPGSQVYLISTNGGEATKLTSFPDGGIDEIAWSPDGKSIAVFFRQTPTDYTTKAADERKENGLSSPVRHHDKLFYRLDAVGYWDGAYQQLFIVDVSTGDHRQLTSEESHLHGISWSPCSKKVAFAANLRENDDLEPGYEGIYTVAVDGSELTRLNIPDGPKNHFAWSPDGTRIAWTGHTDPAESWSRWNNRVLVAPLDGSSETVDLTGSLDKSVGYDTLADLHDVGGGSHLQWSPDSQTLYFPVSVNGDTRLCKMSASGGDLIPLTPLNQELGSFSMSANGDMFAVQLSTSLKPSDVFVGSASCGEWKCESESNKAILSEIEMQEPTPFAVESPDGWPVKGWYLRPANFDPSKNYPAILYVHGGPAAQYGGLAAPFHELQMLAAKGYAVVFGNPRDSLGYGEKHLAAIHGNWGELDWMDVQRFADFADSLPFVDSTRTAIMGGSYGGYMTAWAVGHTNRFKCAIADRLVNNLHSFSGTVDFPWQHGTAWKGNSWSDPADLWRCSPLAFAENIETPLLLVHSDGDLRCPISQAEELFAALRMRRKTVEFVRYPAESSHGLSRNGPPDLRVHRLKTNLEWLNRFLK